MNLPIIHAHASRFESLTPLLQSYVDREILAGVSAAVLQGQQCVYHTHLGYADVAHRIALREDHLFRIYSNSKLLTSIAVLQCVESGQMVLDDAIEKYIPELGQRQVLLPNAKDISQTEAARSSITIRQLLNHTSGLSYGLLDPGTMLYDAYVSRKVLNQRAPLSEMLQALSELPLRFHPGTAWEYSIASDVLGYLIEVVSGMNFDAYLKKHILEPLNMHDTSFWVPSEKHHRFTSHYAGTDMMNQLGRGLKRLDKPPFHDVYLNPIARLSGGGGLISSLGDMMLLLRSLMDDAKVRVLKPETQAMMMQNQLPQGWGIAFTTVGDVPHKGFGFGGAVTLQKGEGVHDEGVDEFEWGGIAGTHWWINPRHQLAGILMTQRHMAFWHPYSFEFKHAVYDAALR